MKNEKVKYLIDMINDMNIKDKLRLAICGELLIIAKEAVLWYNLSW